MNSPKRRKRGDHHNRRVNTLTEEIDEITEEYENKANKVINRLKKNIIKRARKPSNCLDIR
jgi:hypothetical protein